MATFQNSKYESDLSDGTSPQIYKIRVRDETISANIAGLDNAPPAGDITDGFSVKVGGSRRRAGVHARLIHLRLPIVSGGTTVAFRRTSIPALSRSFYDAAITGNAVLTYQGADWEVVGGSPEVVR